jgi:ethylene receptor
MEGYIWLESEGVGKGCTASVIVKLGACDNNLALYQQQILPTAWPSQNATEPSAPRPPPPPPSKDEKLIVPAKPRYQRSL